MKKWYRKTVTRTIVLVVAILSGALLVTNLLSLLTLAGGMSFSQIQKMNTQSFEESEEFSKMVESYMYDVQEKLYLQNLFESDGGYNPKKLVDVMELSKKGKISETNLSGVTYTMEELVNWGETYSGTDNDNLYKQNGVIVCQKPDGNYYYYYMNDFFSLVNAGWANRTEISSWQDCRQVNLQLPDIIHFRLQMKMVICFIQTAGILASL